MMMPSIFGENLFDDWMNFSLPEVEKALYGKREQKSMKTDIKEKGDSYLLEIDLPGYKKDELAVSLENGYLTIQASKNMDKDEKDEDGRYIRRERYAGSVSRSFYVGEGMRQEDICAKYENGILQLTVPKEAPKQVETNKYIAIEG